MTILLAEDDIDDQELLSEAISGIDPTIQMHFFTSGKKILQHLDSLPDQNIPELIILDYNIPEMNGAEILQHLERNPRYNKVIKLVWSTSNSPLYENSCMKHGAQAYMVKPSNISGISDLARRMLSYLN